MSLDFGRSRDPTTAWFERGKWWMVIAAGVNGVGVIPLYTSKDFIKWEYEGEIWNSEDDWIKGVKMIECPDLFKLPGTDLHVLKYSLEVCRFVWSPVRREAEALINICSLLLLSCFIDRSLHWSGAVRAGQVHAAPVHS
jgi:sucrose-6-phosphate hydrolase SacC (GH32 family)